MAAGTCDNCAAKENGAAAHSDVDASDIAKVVVEAVQHLNGRDIEQDLQAAKAFIQVRCITLTVLRPALRQTRG